MYILIDIGGTKIRVASCDSFEDDVTVVEKIPTPEKIEEGMRQIMKIIEKLDGSVDGVAIGVAGVVDMEEKIILRSPNLSGWTNTSFTSYFKDTVSEDNVYVANDTAFGALGEAWHGAGKSSGITAYLTIGTGVGGCRIVDGKIDRARFGFEPGHQIVDISDFLLVDEPLPDEGYIPGHLEYYLSGHNIEDRTGQNAVDVKDEELWSVFQDRLVAALNNVIVMWAPDVIVLGGSMIIRNEFLSFAYMQKALERKVKILPEVPMLQRAILQDDVGLVGAQEYLHQQIK